MKHTAAITALILALGLAPAGAQEALPETDTEKAEPGTDMERGEELLEEGAKLLLRGLMDEMEPALQDMSEALAEAEPMIRDLMTVIGDIDNYHAPEVMPNGDILIRKKTPAEIAADGEGEIEL